MDKEHKGRNIPRVHVIERQYRTSHLVLCGGVFEVGLLLSERSERVFDDGERVILRIRFKRFKRHTKLPLHDTVQ